MANVTQNILPTSKLIANRALSILKNTLLYRELIFDDKSKDYSDQLGYNIGDTINVRHPSKFISKTFEGEVKKQNIENTTIPVRLQYIEDVTVALSAKEQNLDLQSYEEQIVEPAIYALVDKVDATIAYHIFQSALKIVSADSAEPTNLKDISSIGKYFDKAKAPLQNRHLVLSPDMKYRYALTDALSKVSYAGTNVTLRDAQLGRVYGMNTYMSQNTPSTTATKSGTAKGTFSIESSATPGEVKITELSTPTATVKIGDGFCYNDKLYRFTADATGASSTISSVSVVDNNGNAFPEKVEKTSVKIVRGASGIAFHKDAFAFVVKPLEKPMTSAVDYYVATANGLSIRVTRGYDFDRKTSVISFDILFGVATLRPELAVVLQDNF